MRFLFLILISFSCFGQKYAALNSRIWYAKKPTVQSSTITFTSVQKNQFTINWTNGNGQNSLVVVRASGAVDDVPIDGIVYSANSVFGSGDQVGIFNYVVYKGSGTSVTVTGLTTNTRYHVRIFTINGSEGLGYSNYLTSTASGNPANQATLTESDLTVTVYSGSNLTSFGQPNSQRQYGFEYANTSTLINSAIYDQIQLEVNVSVATGSTNNPRGYLGYSYFTSPPYDDAVVIGTQSVGTDAVTFGSTGVKTTSFLTIPAGAKSASTRFLLLENGGNGSSPSITSMIIRCKQIPVP